jgi:hypothetical protein
MSEPGYLDFSAPAGVQEVVSDAERTVRAATEAATAISRRRAERDRQAAARNEEMRQNGPAEAEATDAADTVAKAYPSGPSARLNRTAQQERRGGSSRVDGPGHAPQQSPRQVESPSR